ncbi:arsenite resistance protein Ars2 [Sporothrix brasiliensis 5110]|uniref:Arsenite resistance protein Ars2 n=1 Tax=Sporothrix brasiliensis 5110 TaxID=1398154 RepID=A0A0C2IKW7_9PEZI|nr:arsenite resistance protein Ars2 [Sporothrix brasiliensis 5110]KIH87605.1 arsenite resistance protein Ars2 [Sporothrix brasiliensis 5110]
MDSYFRADSMRSPPDRSWNDGRKDDRDPFYRGRSPGQPERNRRPARSRSPTAVDRYEPRSRVRDEYGNGGGRDRDRDDRRRINSPPANIDRYVPGQPLHLATSSGGITTLTPPLHQQPPRPALTNPMPDPLTLPYQVGFSFFGEWWRTNEKIKEENEAQRTGRRPERERQPRGPKEAQEEKAKIQAAYDAYKEEVQGKMATAFVKQHKDEQWFIERYVPAVRDPLRQQLAEVRKTFYSQWEQDLETGLFDEFTLEGVSKSDTLAVAAAVEKEEGEAAANDVLGVGDLVPAVAAADIRDESLTAPTLLIKTIAPTVSRQNLENFCREHLGEGEGGYRWLSLSDPNPGKRYHRIGWIMLNPGPEGGFPVQDEDGNVDIENPATVPVAERALEAVNSKTVKDEVRGDFTCHVGVHNPPTNFRKKALWDLFSAPERIDRDLHLVQRLVAKFEADVDSTFNGVFKVEEKVEELRHTGRLQPVHVPSTRPAAAKKRKAQKSRRVDMDVNLDFEVGGDDEMDDIEDGEEDEEEEDGEELEDGVVVDDVDDEYVLGQKKQLDLLIEYLRRVFNFCFFCVFESDSVHELTRKCPGGHLRRPRSSLTPAALEVARASAHGEPFPVKRHDPSSSADAEEGELPDEGGRGGAGGDKGSGGKGRASLPKAEQQLLRAFNWVKTFEEKISQVLDPESTDLRKFGGKPLDDALNDELANHVKQEDEHKYRCKLPECTKLFKEEHFWRKHVEKRHSEWYEALKADLELVNAYAADPAHIAPSRTDASSNGHFSAGAGQTPTGTPRGFNLHNYNLSAAGGLPPMPGFPGPGGNSGFNMFNPVAMQVPGSWQSPVGGSPGGPGPIRRSGGTRHNNNRTGPYDRRPMRWNPDSGITGGSPMHGGGGGRGGRNGGGGPGGFAVGGAVGLPGRWDGAGGGSAVGPREAIQGRTIKSYDDLDQAGNGAGGELNY